MTRYISIWKWSLPLAICLLGIIVIQLTLGRKEGYATIHTSYQDLYALSEMLAIESFAFDSSGVLTVRLFGGGVGNNDDPKKLVLREGQNDQFLEPYNLGAVPAFRTIWGSDIPVPVIGNPRLRVGLSPFGVSDFAASAGELNAENVARARQIAFAEFDVDPTAPALSQLRALSLGLYRSLYPHRGFPEAYMRDLDGYQQYLEAKAGSSGIYCGNHAEIFAFFASSIGIPTRIVDVAGQYDGVVLGAHAFVESYLDDLGQWIYIDLQLEVFGIRDERSRYINTADLLHRLASGSTDGLRVDTLTRDGVITEPFVERAEEITTFIHPQVDLVYLWNDADRYSFLKRLERLLLKPRRSYSLRRSGIGTQIRLGATYVLVLLVFVWIALLIQSWRVPKS